MSKRETRLLALACTFIGIVIGFFISPVKAGISCGNNNTVQVPEDGRKKRRAGRRCAAGENHSTEDTCEF